MDERVRAVALAIIWRRDQLLIFDVPDPIKNVTGFRPPGGTIEFGETGAETVIREITEELDLDVIEPRYLGTIENIFEWRGRPGHELVRLYTVRFRDESVYARDEFACVEATAEAFVCRWKAISDFDREPLYPNGLLDLLRA